ncbi:metallophosphoesterase family protein [Maricaulis parjimensis]|uniref:metallophosphoesterase family protein n=1 Tax=Maricaulis parjimensis TaxID=144023 RepID=UPI00193A09B0|nr:metallophosphoesterase family protein [Maricaulis parjimensis]
MFEALKGWMRGRGAGPAPEIARLTYAIGDIHGRRDLLRRLLDRIEDDREGRPAEYIFLGDYVDRGDDSAGVLTDLILLGARPDISVVFLKGNHEAAMLDFLKDPAKGPEWVQYGGGETLASYGVRPPRADVAQDMEAWTECRRAFSERLTPAHRGFLDRLGLMEKRGDYLFVHAGVDPNRPLEEQGEPEFLWIRDAFLASSKRLDHVVVHGHTPEDRPTCNGRRIGVDTGAYLTGKLTAACLFGRDVKFIST